MVGSRTLYAHRNRGFTLLELLVSCVIIVTLLNLCLGMYISFNRLRTNSEAASVANFRITEIDTAFRKSVRQAAQSRDSFLDFKASDSLLILENADSDEITILGTLNEAAPFSVSRYQRTDNDWSLEYLKTFDLNEAQYRFDTTHPKAVALTVTVNNKGFRHTLPGTNTLYAALREGGSS